MVRNLSTSPARHGNRVRLRTAVLGLLTATFLAGAVIGARQLWLYRLPTDHVLWKIATAPDCQPASANCQLGLEAVARQQPSPVRVGDRLLAIQGQTVATPETVARMLFDAGIGATLPYTLVRGGQTLTVPVPVRASSPPLLRYTYFLALALLYLGMGIFVLYRRRDARYSLHFYLFCLASFLLYGLHFTGKWNVFDRAVFCCNEAALLLVPALFLHFALRFQSPLGGARPRWARAAFRFPMAAMLLYAPGILLGLGEIALASGALALPVSLGAAQDLLDHAAYVVFTLYFLIAAAVFADTARRAGTTAPLLRIQARCMSRGAFAAILPFTVFYVFPYMAGADWPRWTGVAVLALGLIPIAFVFALWRHQLLEAEIVFRRGIVYTLATAAVVAVYLGVVSLAGILIQIHRPSWGWMGWLLAILVTALLFDPVKSGLQERLDRLFYRERYDFRRTLVEFGRQMSAEPDLGNLLSLVLDRLTQTLSVARVAIFLAPADRLDGGFQLAGFRGDPPPPPALDLAFLGAHFGQSFASDKLEPTRLFWENPAHAPGMNPTAQTALRLLNLHYYLPCRLQGRTVAVIGLGKTLLDDYLASDDLALVETLSGYLAIALENARLYATLRSQMAEYERLKDFNENIVESIQVGVVAVNLDGRVESWNAQMEVLSAHPRQAALGRELGQLLGPDLAALLARAAGAGGIHSFPGTRLLLGGQAKIVDIAIAPLVTARLERVGWILLLSDVTAEAELHQQLMQADRLRSVGLLAAGVAHEVNTPLAVISSYAQMLAKQTSADDPRAAALDKITRQTFRASEIVANLLNFSRTGAAQFREIEINAVVRETLGLVEHPLRTAGIQVIVALHPEMLWVNGDAGKLQQVFLNLILNARDAMPTGGVLQLVSGASGHQAWAEVIDSGVGIPAELHHRIFDPFFTTKSTIKSNGKTPASPLFPPRPTAPPGAASMSTGTGLGLAVTYGIVQEHGGTIVVRSAPDCGAGFRVALPLVRLGQPTAPALDSQLPPAELAQRSA